ncbi:hypothetical protein HDU96_010879, partial [Phlyctochytrium bullatum]
QLDRRGENVDDKVGGYNRIETSAQEVGQGPGSGCAMDNANSTINRDIFGAFDQEHALQPRIVFNARRAVAAGAKVQI